MQYPGRVLRSPAHPAGCLPLRPHQRRELRLAGAQPGLRLGGDVNLRMIFDALFTPEAGSGYPPHRAEPQRQARELLRGKFRKSRTARWPRSCRSLPEEVVRPGVDLPGLPPGAGSRPPAGRSRASASPMLRKIMPMTRLERRISQGECNGRKDRQVTQAHQGVLRHRRPRQRRGQLGHPVLPDEVLHRRAP